ncbi:MAG: sugar phosphate isomerase/epimerase, partial [Planctomycetes bacterium]|nr:sugar phosphate isomerase/epimerase [Planctomycetota bacterium]
MTLDIMRISTCTYPVRDKDAETALALMAKVGFKKVDLWGNMPHFSANPSQMDIAKLQAAAEKLGVKIANLGTYCGAKFASEKEAEQEAALADMKATIDIAAKLG